MIGEDFGLRSSATERHYFMDAASLHSQNFRSSNSGEDKDTNGTKYMPPVFIPHLPPLLHSSSPKMQWVTKSKRSAKFQKFPLHKKGMGGEK